MPRLAFIQRIIGGSRQSLYNFPLFVAQLIPCADTTFATTWTPGIIHELDFAEVAANRASSEPGWAVLNKEQASEYQL